MLASFGTFVGLNGLPAELASGPGRPVAAQHQAVQTTAIAQPSPETRHFARAPDGMFYLTGVVNGQAIRFMVDTGANVTVLTPADARLVASAKSASEPERSVMTASGPVRGYNAQITELKIGGRSLQAVRAVVLETGMGVSLIGQDTLRKLGPMTFDGDRMTLHS